MTNPFFEYSDSIPPVGTARAEPVSTEFQSVETSFELVNTQLGLRIKLPSGAGNEITAAAEQRALKGLGFNAAGLLDLLSALGTWRGDWATTTVYQNQDIVRDPVSPKSLYIAKTSHTAGASFDATEKSTNWTLMIDLTELSRAEALSFAFSVNNANFNAVNGGDYGINCASTVVATLPASPAANDHVRFLHLAGTVSNFSIARNGKLIMGLAEDLTFSATGDANATNFAFALVFINDTYGWRIYPV
jgi:hypothetical protein